MLPPPHMLGVSECRSSLLMCIIPSPVSAIILCHVPISASHCSSSTSNAKCGSACEASTINIVSSRRSEEIFFKSYIFHVTFDAALSETIFTLLVYFFAKSTTSISYLSSMFTRSISIH